MNDLAVPNLKSRDRHHRRGHLLPRRAVGQTQPPVGSAVSPRLEHQARLIDDHPLQADAPLQQRRPGQCRRQPPRFEQVGRGGPRRVAQANPLRHEHRLRQKRDLQRTVEHDLAPGGARQSLRDTCLVRLPVDDLGQDEQAADQGDQTRTDPGQSPHKPSKHPDGRHQEGHRQEPWASHRIRSPRPAGCPSARPRDRRSVRAPRSPWPPPHRWRSRTWGRRRCRRGSGWCPVRGPARWNCSR